MTTDDDSPTPEQGDRQPLQREVRLSLPTLHALRQIVASPHFLAVVALAMSVVAIAWTARVSRRLQTFATLSIAIDASRDSSAKLRNPLDSALRAWEIQSEIRNYNPTVDLTDSALQPIGLGFMVSQLSVAAAPSGVRITGLIVNPQAVDYQTAEFEIQAHNSTRTFSVFRLVAGGSSRFSVVVPEVDADSTTYARIKYLSATIGYRRPQ